jgi:hypothetical protein
MPDAIAGVSEDERARVEPGVTAALVTRPGVGSETDGSPGAGGPEAALPGFAAAFRSTYNATTGETYQPHFDDVNAPAFATVTREDDLIAGATVTTVDPTAGEVTLYLGLFEDSTEARVSVPVPAGTVAALVVRSSAAPGAGKSYTYTVMKNGVAQAMAVTVSGDGEQGGSTTANGFTCATGDRLSVRLVADSGAAAAHHRYSVRYSVTT